MRVASTAMLTADVAANLVQQAVLVPSSHNTQPSRFRVADTAIDLFADRTRALPLNDPTAPRRPLADVIEQT